LRYHSINSQKFFAAIYNSKEKFISTNGLRNVRRATLTGTYHHNSDGTHGNDERGTMQRLRMAHFRCCAMNRFLPPVL